MPFAINVVLWSIHAKADVSMLPVGGGADYAVKLNGNSSFNESTVLLVAYVLQISSAGNNGFLGIRLLSSTTKVY